MPGDVIAVVQPRHRLGLLVIETDLYDLMGPRGTVLDCKPGGLRSEKKVPGTNGTRIRINVLRINDLRSTLTSIRFIELYINNIE